MAYEGKKQLDVVSEQPGVRQEKVVSESSENTKADYDEKGKSRFQHKPGTESRVKNEAAKYHDTGLDHPVAQYETYKRPRRDN